MEARSPLKEFNRQNQNEATDIMKPMESVKDDRLVNVDLIKTDQENDASGAKANKNQQLDSLKNPLKIEISGEENLSFNEDGLLSDSDDFQSISPINKDDELLLNITQTPQQKLLSGVKEGVYLSPAAIIRVNSYNQKNKNTSYSLEINNITKEEGSTSVKLDDINIPTTPKGKLANVSEEIFSTPSAVNNTVSNQADSGLELSQTEEANLNKTSTNLEFVEFQEEPKSETQKKISDIFTKLDNTFVIDEPKAEEPLFHITQKKIPTLESAELEDISSEKPLLNIIQEKIPASILESAASEDIVPTTLAVHSKYTSEEPLSKPESPLLEEKPKSETQEKIYDIFTKLDSTVIEEPKAEEPLFNIIQEKIPTSTLESAAPEDIVSSTLAVNSKYTSEEPLSKPESPLLEEDIYTKLDSTVVIEEPKAKEPLLNITQEKIPTLESAELEDISSEKPSLNIIQEKIPTSLTLESAEPEDIVSNSFAVKSKCTSEETLSKLDNPLLEEEPKSENITSEKENPDKTFELEKELNCTQEKKVFISGVGKLPEINTKELNLLKEKPKSENNILETENPNKTFEVGKVQEKILPTPEESNLSKFESPSLKAEPKSGNTTLEKENPYKTFEEEKEPQNKILPPSPPLPGNKRYSYQPDLELDPNAKSENNILKTKDLNKTFEKEGQLNSSQKKILASSPLPGNKEYTYQPDLELIPSEDKKCEINTENLNQFDHSKNISLIDSKLKSPLLKEIKIENLNKIFEKETQEISKTPSSSEVTKEEQFKDQTDSDLEFNQSEEIILNKTTANHQTTVEDLKEIIPENIKKEEDVTSPTVSLVESKIKEMADLTTEQQREISDLKFQLQQARASLELEIRQKEEIVIKTQAERNDFKSEIKELKEMLRESKILENNIENGGSKDKELEEQVKEAKEKAAQATHELKKKEAQLMKLMEDYERNFSVKISEQDKLNEMHQTAKMHLANLEFSFSDVHKKYERLKVVLEGYKSNETTLKSTVAMAQNNLKKADERYEQLYNYAQGQMDKCNKEIQQQKKLYEDRHVQLNAINKRIEIKCKSLESSLKQKESECQQLTALCDELTGKNMSLN